MIIEKITHGYVIQRYDTEKGCFVSQRFIADNNCEYEDYKITNESANAIPIMDYMADKYLPFDMVQPCR